MGMFSKIESVARQFANNFVRSGTYWVRIDELRTGKGRKGDHWRFSGPVVYVIDDNEGKGHKIGEEIKRMRGQQTDSWLAEFKSLICCAMDCEDEDISEADCDTATGDSQPLAGMVIEIRAREVVTKKSTPTDLKTFTQVDYVRNVTLPEVQKVIAPETWAKFFVVK